MLFIWILSIFLDGTILVVGFFPSTHRHVDVIMMCFKLKEQIFVLTKVHCSFAAETQSCFTACVISFYLYFVSTCFNCLLCL